jgi:hypothetical protein
MKLFNLRTNIWIVYSVTLSVLTATKYNFLLYPRQLSFAYIVPYFLPVLLNMSVSELGIEFQSSDYRHRSILHVRKKKNLTFKTTLRKAEVK